MRATGASDERVLVLADGAPLREALFGPRVADRAPPRALFGAARLGVACLAAAATTVLNRAFGATNDCRGVVPDPPPPPPGLAADLGFDGVAPVRFI